MSVVIDNMPRNTEPTKPSPKSKRQVKRENRSRSSSAATDDSSDGDSSGDSSSSIDSDTGSAQSTTASMKTRSQSRKSGPRPDSPRPAQSSRSSPRQSRNPDLQRRTRTVFRTSASLPRNCGRDVVIKVTVDEDLDDETMVFILSLTPDQQQAIFSGSTIEKVAASGVLGDETFVILISYLEGSTPTNGTILAEARALDSSGRISDVGELGRVRVLSDVDGRKTLGLSIQPASTTSKSRPNSSARDVPPLIGNTPHCTIPLHKF
jgi:hypothetical protein